MVLFLLLLVSQSPRLPTVAGWTLYGGKPLGGHLGSKSTLTVPQGAHPPPAQPHFSRFTIWVPILSPPHEPVGWALGPCQGDPAGER